MWKIFYTSLLRVIHPMIFPEKPKWAHRQRALCCCSQKDSLSFRGIATVTTVISTDQPLPHKFAPLTRLSGRTIT
jgi:hypothetical protein